MRPCLKLILNFIIPRCIEEEAGEGKKIVEITCDHQGEYEAQLELAIKTEQEYERKARSRIGINDYVSTI